MTDETTNQAVESNKLDLKSLDVAAQKREELRRLLNEAFPEACSEGFVNFDQLKRALGEWVEPDRERFGLNWPGKAECMKIVQEPSLATLKPMREASVDFDKTENVFIEGDNLEVLKLLQKSYFGKVKMIYIDPPYNTGNEFIYPDKFSESLETYLAYTGQRDEAGRRFSTNAETSGRYHTNWLNMMYPRLYLAKNLLREDGVIFISIDDHEVMNLRAMCDQIFGEENHVATISVLNNLKGRNDKKNIATCHEYIIAYAKHNFISYGVPLNAEQLSQYKFKDERQQAYALRDLRKRGRPDKREDRPNMFFPIFYNQSSQKCYLKRNSLDDVEIFPKRGDGSDGRWRWGKKKVESNLEILKPRYSSQKNRWDIEHRVYLNENITSANSTDEEADDDDQIFERTAKPKSFWWGGEISTDVANREFKYLFEEINPSYPKSPYLIEKLLHMSTKSGDLILDFFGGYSTTAHSVLAVNMETQTNRKFIVVQLPEITSQSTDEYKAGYKTIADIGRERIRRAGKKILEERTKAQDGQLALEDAPPPLDVGFRAFRLDRSNFLPWDGGDGSLEILEEQLKLHVDPIDKASTPEDLLYEIILKSGYSLAEPIASIMVGNNRAYSLRDHSFVICLDDQISVEFADALIDYSPSRVVCLDRAFAGDDQLKANLVQAFKNRSRNEETEIVFLTV